MKKFLYIICCFLFFTCEDVINLDLKTAPPKLVIDASLTWVKGTLGNNQTIKLSLTAPFYSTTIPPATGATVTVTDSQNNNYTFTEEDATGIYQNQSFLPEINGTYNLKIIYKNEVYTATETLMPVTEITNVEQKNDGGFSGDEIEIKTYYSDPKDIKNYYLFEYTKTEKNKVNIDVFDDEFTDGNLSFSFFSDDELKTGDELIIKSYGISARFYEYMFILIQQNNAQDGDPFQVQPGVIRGNCVNETNPENFPLGYFRASEVSVFNYSIQ